MEQGGGRRGRQGPSEPPPASTPEDKALPTLPYRREETEDLGSHSELPGHWAGPSRSDAWIPACSICSSRDAHSEVLRGKLGLAQARPTSEESSQVGSAGPRPGMSRAESSLWDQRLGEAV